MIRRISAAWRMPKRNVTTRAAVVTPLGPGATVGPFGRADGGGLGGGRRGIGVGGRGRIDRSWSLVVVVRS